MDADDVAAVKSGPARKPPRRRAAAAAVLAATRAAAAVTGAQAEQGELFGFDKEATPRLAGFAPVVRGDARLLILGSFPGEASLAAGQYYAHPRNHFWRLLGLLLGEPLDEMPYPARLKRLKARRIALWDVAASCRREGSLDAAIRDLQANAFERLLGRAPGIAAVAFNGKTAGRFAPALQAHGLRTYVLPSTSPANAQASFDEKLAAWSALREDGWL